MNELQIFRNPEFGQLRTLMIDDEMWAVGKDVALALGYKEPTKAVRDRVDSEDRGMSKIDTPSGPQNMTVINVSGIFSLILSSKLDSAKRYKHWVTSEVLPAIHRQGYYAAPALETERQLEEMPESVSTAYLHAARTISQCRRDQLPLVLDPIRQAGIHLESVSTLASAKKAREDAEEVRAIREEAVRVIRTARNAGLTYDAIAKEVGFHRAMVRAYYIGRSVPRMEKALDIIDRLTAAFPDLYVNDVEEEEEVKA